MAIVTSGSYESINIQRMFRFFREVTDPTSELHPVYTILRENRAMTRVFNRNSLTETAPLKVKNRRGATRYDVSVPVCYRTPETNLPSGWKSGRSLDMSASGLRIEIPETVVVVGTMLELAIDWTGLYHGRPAIRLFLTGSVVRVDERGTALRIVTHQFREVSQAGAGFRRAERTLAVAS
jgi:PilZ domain